MTAPAGCDSAIPAFPPLKPIEEIDGETSGENALPFEEFLSAEAQESLGGQTTSTSNASSESTPDEAGLDPTPAEAAVVPVLSPAFAVPLTLLLQTAPPAMDAPPPAEAATDSAGFERIEHKLPPTSSSGPPGLEVIAENAPLDPAKPGGMSAAKQPAMVFIDSTFEESAEAAETRPPVLVEQTEDRVSERRIATPDSGMPRDLQPMRKIERAEQDGVSSAGIAQLAARTTREFSVADAVVSVERAHHAASRLVEEVHGHVQVLRTTGQEKLEVIVRPVPGTELRLEVSRMDGLVTVQARCDRGDFAVLEASWPHVQSSLAAQGVRVEALQLTPPNDANHRPGQGQQQQHGREQNAAREIFFEQDTNESRTTAQGRKQSDRQNRGWQRWA
jgi:hypothetical protein